MKMSNYTIYRQVVEQIKRLSDIAEQLENNETIPESDLGDPFSKIVKEELKQAQ